MTREITPQGYDHRVKPINKVVYDYEYGGIDAWTICERCGEQPLLAMDCFCDQSDCPYDHEDYWAHNYEEWLLVARHNEDRLWKWQQNIKGSR